LTPDPPSAAFNFLTRVALSYATLLDTPLAHPETGLGGKLFYAAELDEEGRALLVAANIAGAATLAASADRDEQKQALRDGIADFVVTNLDEALRILKNQLRKHETVAVCIAQSPSEIEREMNERGVAPDLLRRDLSIPLAHSALAFHEGEETELDLGKIPALVTWQVDSALPKDLALLDEIALPCLDPNEWKSRRWLRLAPRYLGRLAHGLRLLETHREFNARFWEQVAERTDRNEIVFAFEIVSYFRGTHDIYRFAPTKP
jgi:Urocanase Rossmann-like domain